jgi:hypothetical protein
MAPSGPSRSKGIGGICHPPPLAAIAEPDEHKAGCMIGKAPDDVVDMRAQRRRFVYSAKFGASAAEELRKQGQERVRSLLGQEMTSGYPLGRHLCRPGSPDRWRVIELDLLSSSDHQRWRADPSAIGAVSCVMISV